MFTFTKKAMKIMIYTNSLYINSYAKMYIYIYIYRHLKKSKNILDGQ